MLWFTFYYFEIITAVSQVVAKIVQIVPHILPPASPMASQETDIGIINQSIGLIQFSLVFTRACVCVQFFYTEHIWHHHSQCSELFHQPRGTHSFMIPFYGHSPLVLLPIPEQTLISSPALLFYPFENVVYMESHMGCKFLRLSTVPRRSIQVVCVNSSFFFIVESIVFHDMDVSQLVKTEWKNTLYLFSYTEAEGKILSLTKVILEHIFLFIMKSLSWKY